MVLLEVEQKFSFNPLLRNVFRLNKGSPAFLSLASRGTQRFSDAYFDRGNIFSNNGIWIRKREGAWELKRRVAGSFTRTAFEEINDYSRIQKIVGQFLPDTLEKKGDNLGLDVICQFTTTRESFLADDKFSVMLDSTDFGHAVGEIELAHENAQEAHRDIDVFMKKYAWFFDNSRPKGKLTAYFEKFGDPV
ncbi:CYTH-like domain-containing protein [Aspergillus caelatus]|uniref:CYTH-like domain-containing protein n=1 Tax=Aspergillus caelatus TaxID=61420 RepID=A0A5N6ZKC1_9EURO|nr:CYTH-like domain-containing protein [Aspergillus caelatus]KAE8357818.1 CYTH-like domain-containing protein [Aspergillus caelatus]